MHAKLVVGEYEEGYVCYVEQTRPNAIARMQATIADLEQQVSCIGRYCFYLWSYACN